MSTHPSELTSLDTNNLGIADYNTTDHKVIIEAQVKKTLQWVAKWLEDYSLKDGGGANAFTASMDFQEAVEHITGVMETFEDRFTL